MLRELHLVNLSQLTVSVVHHVTVRELSGVLVGRHVLVACGHILTIDTLGELLVDDLILVDGLLTLVHLLGCRLGLLTETGLHLLLSLNQALTLWGHLLTGL
ncbi:hypothetical protein LJEJJENJ_00005 [Klebsiella phage 066038]|nr:hypothetical protein LJEJJENJ_00005 [Klebsiella phage 066038]